MTNWPPPPSGSQEPSSPQEPATPQPAAPPLPQAPAATAPVMPSPWWMQPQPKKSWGKRILLTIGIILFAFSILLNLILIVALALTAGTQSDLESVVTSDGSSSQIVAVYTIQGTIGEDVAGEFGKFYRQVKKDSNIKAVVLRVDSPGGGVAASDQIYNMVYNINNTLKKPVVISMGGVAASGGYYISAPAQKIVAEPTTITGSIGVISVWPVLKDFLNNHGVDVVTIRSRQSQANKATENYWESPSDKTRGNVMAMLSKMHERFEKVVRLGRPGLKTKTSTVNVGEGKNVSQVQEVEPLNGKVYLADEAMALGLVDQIGYLADAVDQAGQIAELDNPRVVHYVKSQSFRDLIGVSESHTLIDPKSLDKLLSPQILMLWKVD